MKKEVSIIFLLGIIIGELNIWYGNIYYGLGIYMLILTVIIILTIFIEKMRDFLQIFILLTLLRIINFSIPAFDVNIKYILIYAIMLIPAYYIVRSKEKEHSYVYIPIAITVGTILMIIDNIWNLVIPVEIGGILSTMFLIIFLVISILTYYTKYWNKYLSDMFEMISYSFLSIFVAITVFRIMTIS